MHLHLVDLDSDVVEAWREAFAGHREVVVDLGDILQVAHDVLVSPANSQGHMDGGIDRRYLEFFGDELQARLYEAVARRPEGHLPVGAAVMVPTGNARIPHLLIAPTMVTPGPVPPSHAFFAMTAVLKLASRSVPAAGHVFSPGLATGIGEVPPKLAASEMAAAYRKWTL